MQHNQGRAAASLPDQPGHALAVTQPQAPTAMISDQAGVRQDPGAALPSEHHTLAGSNHAALSAAALALQADVGTSHSRLGADRQLPPGAGCCPVLPQQHLLGLPTGVTSAQAPQQEDLWTQEMGTAACSLSCGPQIQASQP